MVPEPAVDLQQFKTNDGPPAAPFVSNLFGEPQSPAGAFHMFVGPKPFRGGAMEKGHHLIEFV